MAGNQPQLQSSLGEVASNKTKVDRVWNLGTIALGVVLKVHAKRYTADVRIFGTNDKFSSSHDQEGRYSCRIGVGNAGFDNEFQKPYGEVVPIQKNSIVLVGFLRNSKEKPVIFSVFHNISESVDENNYKNILDSVYSNDGKGEVSRYLNITPIQDFVSLDRNGNLEIVSHTKSFFVAKDREMDEEEFDFEDLSVKKSDNTTVSVDQKYSAPLKFMAVFRDKFLDSATNWLKIFIDASKTSFKLVKLQQAENKSSFFEIDKNGGIKMRRQLDTRSFEGSREYTEVLIDKNGVIRLQVTGLETTSSLEINAKGDVLVDVMGDKNTSMTITGTGININSDNPISVSTKEKLHLSSDSSIDIDCPNVANLTAETVNINKVVNMQKLNVNELNVTGNTTAKFLTTTDLKTNTVNASHVSTDSFIDSSMSVGDINMNAQIGDKTIEEYMADMGTSEGSWLYCVQAVKAMLASKGLSYSQADSVTYNFNGYSTTVHPDCSGTVTAMISMYTGKSMSQIGSSSFTSRNSLEGFTKQSWSGWDNLQTGDIIARDGHVEVFAYQKNGQNYVWNAGSTSSVQSATPTVSGHDSYTIVWRANQ